MAKLLPLEAVDRWGTIHVLINNAGNEGWAIDEDEKIAVEGGY